MSARLRAIADAIGKPKDCAEHAELIKILIEDCESDTGDLEIFAFGFETQDQAGPLSIVHLKYRDGTEATYDASTQESF